jgi:hypothetical protein
MIKSDELNFLIDEVKKTITEVKKSDSVLLNIYAL